MENKHNPLQDNSFDRAGGGFGGGESGFAPDGDEADFNFDADNNGFNSNNAPPMNEGFDFNTNRYQRG